MSSIKFTDPDHWSTIEEHLSSAGGERFAFAFTDTIANGPAGPVLEVVGVTIVDDKDVEGNRSGWSLADTALDRIHNQAVASGRGLIEFHNHHLGPPGFSRTDEQALEPMAPYMLDLLSVPYGAVVWAEGAVHAEWWRTSGTGGVERGQFRTVVVHGDHLRVLNARPVVDGRFDRQIPLLGTAAQAAIGTLRVAVVGAGGTGSHICLQLAYLGFRDVLILDDDDVEVTNLNRLVTAEQSDLGLPKSVVAKRRIRAIDPACQVETQPALTVGGEHPELLDVDLIIGCVDHDGPRQRLNAIAMQSGTPYLDIATGVDQGQDPPAIGGRVVFVLPAGPCLTCLRELDSAEVGRWAKPSAQGALDRRHGYGTGLANPSVVFLNGLAVSAAVVELAAWLSGARPPARWLDIDLAGNSGRPGTVVGPLAIGGPDERCIDCSSVRRRFAV